MNTNLNNTPKVTARIDWYNKEPKDIYRGVATVTIADSFQVHGVRIVNGKNGIFVAMPTRPITDKSGEKKYVEICHPINSDMRKSISDAVLSEYEQTIKQASENAQDASGVSTETETDQALSEDSFEEEDDEEVPVMTLS